MDSQVSYFSNWLTLCLGTRFNQSQEVFGLALGNMLSGALGGSPVTGVLVRTSVNVTSGATYKTSQFINSLFVLLIVLVFMPAFVYMPLPAIASILITSAFRMIPFKVMKHLIQVDPAEFVVLLTTMIVCVMVDGAVGLGVGGVISVLRTAVKLQNSHEVSLVMEHGVPVL